MVVGGERGVVGGRGGGCGDGVFMRKTIHLHKKCITNQPLCENIHGKILEDKQLTCNANRFRPVTGIKGSFGNITMLNMLQSAASYCP